MELNASLVQGLTDLQLVEAVHKTSVIAPIWLVWGVTLIIVLVMGLIIINKSKGEKPLAKFIMIWLLAVVFSGLFVIFLTFSPHSTNNISNLF